MTQQKIIRNVTTMDRGEIRRINHLDVLDAIQGLGMNSFTSCDVAEFMGIRCHEPSVRKAVDWLRRKGLVRHTGMTERKKYRPGHGVKHINLYSLVTTSRVDFDVLNSVFVRYESEIISSD